MPVIISWNPKSLQVVQMEEKFNFRVDGFLFWYNPYEPIGSDPPTHPNPYGVRILKSVQIIGPSLS